jgi:hypothetical protein
VTIRWIPFSVKHYGHETQLDWLDLQYLSNWAEQLGVQALLARIRESAEE